MTHTERAAEVHQIVANFALHYWQQLLWQVGQFVPGGDTEIGLKHQLTEENIFTHAMEPQEWLLMARFGQGLNNEDPAYVYEICQGMVEWMFGIADISNYDIPDAWADSPMGGLWWAAFIRVQGDELITIAEAAKIAGVSVQAMSQRANRNKLKTFTDPYSDGKRQGRRLVRKSDVLKAESDE